MPRLPHPCIFIQPPRIRLCERDVVPADEFYTVCDAVLHCVVSSKLQPRHIIIDRDHYPEKVSARDSLPIEWFGKGLTSLTRHRKLNRIPPNTTERI